jgi:hypothetical protein
LAELHPCAV